MEGKPEPTHTPWVPAELQVHSSCQPSLGIKAQEWLSKFLRPLLLFSSDPSREQISQPPLSGIAGESPEGALLPGPGLALHTILHHFLPLAGH